MYLDLLMQSNIVLSSMHCSLLLLFLVSASAIPLGYYFPLNPFYQWQPGTQPVVISLPEEGEVIFQCKEAGAFPNRENACKSYFVCIEQGNTGTFSVSWCRFSFFSFLQTGYRWLRGCVVLPWHLMSTLEFVTGRNQLLIVSMSTVYE